MKKVLKVLEEWFQAMELGGQYLKEPSLSEGVVNKEKVNSLIEIIDAFFEDELKKNSKYWQHKDRRMTDPPDFNRLESGARLAFYQDVYAAVKGEI